MFVVRSIFLLFEASTTEILEKLLFGCFFACVLWQEWIAADRKVPALKDLQVLSGSEYFCYFATLKVVCCVRIGSWKRKQNNAFQ